MYFDLIMPSFIRCLAETKPLRSACVMSIVMAESRRVHFTTLSSDVPSSSENPAAAPKSPAGVLQVDNRPEGPTDTFRLVLTLFDPDERSFPEFSYSQLVDNKVASCPDKTEFK